MAQVTDGWTESERESFCSLLTRFNTALSARQAGMSPMDQGVAGLPSINAQNPSAVS